MPRILKFRQSLRLCLMVVIAVATLRTLAAQELLGFLERAKPYAPACGTEDLACAAWAHYRTAHPYPYQAIEWVRLPDRRIAIMLLEPPPVMSKARIEKLTRDAFGADLQSYDRYKWHIGVDGWLEDTVLTVSPPQSAASDPLQDTLFRDRIAFLYVALFGTAYGASFDVQEGRLTGPSEAAPNLTIQPGEVRRWMTQTTLKWEPIGDAPRKVVSWQGIKTQRLAGSFVSTDGSLVVMSFPSDKVKLAAQSPDALDFLRVAFRCFAVATDSIVGAFQSEGQLAILGRPRTQSMMSVPPLRFETFKLLAAQTSDELSQSYERRSLFAGKMMSGQYELEDWAPIYLSDPLVDTEFGMLLDTTDQLLKSWSEAGHIEYFNFNYPKPRKFPFLSSLSDKVMHDSGQSSVLYNWNTAGSAVRMDTGNATTWTTRQTGALPVTYGAGTRDVETAKLQIDEETAYNYFAKLKDANLNRVVQYSFLYQVFRSVTGEDERGRKDSAESYVSAEQERAARARHQAATIRVKATEDLMHNIETGQIHLEPKTLEEFSTKLRRFRSQNPDLASDLQVAAILADRFSDEGKRLTESQKKIFLPMEAELDREIQAYNTDVLRQQSGLWKLSGSGSSDLAVRKQAIQAQQQKLLERVRDNPILDVRLILERVAKHLPEMEGVKQGIIASYTYEIPGAIKTPSIVISWDRSDSEAVGGHNIGARTLRFVPSEKVQGVALEETEQGTVVRYSAAKTSMVEGHATEIARAVEHRGVNNPEELDRILAPPVVVRSRTAALELPAAKAGVNSHESWTAGLGGRRFTEKSQFVDQLGALARESDCCEFVAYDDRGYAFATEKNPAPPPVTITYELRDTPSMASHLERAAEKGRPMIFMDMPQDHVEALTLQASLDNGRGANLEDVATRLGSQRPDIVEPRIDGIADRDLHGNLGFLKTSGGRSTPAARGLFERFTAPEPASSWAGAEVRSLGKEEVDGFTSASGWDSQKDGTPTAVMVSFGRGGGGQPPIDVSVVAGFAEPDSAAGRGALNAIHERNLALARQKGESLARYALTVRNELRRMPQPRVKRLVVLVQDGKTRQLLSIREWREEIGGDATQPAE